MNAHLPVTDDNQTTHEPEYLRQYGPLQGIEPDEYRAWFRACEEEAKAEGIKFMRLSVDDVDYTTMALFEGWKERPIDQGPVRWQMKVTSP